MHINPKIHKTYLYYAYTQSRPCYFSKGVCNNDPWVFCVIHTYIHTYRGEGHFGVGLFSQTKIDRNLKLQEVVDTHGGRALKGFKKFWPRPMTSQSRDQSSKNDQNSNNKRTKAGRAYSSPAYERYEGPGHFVP